MLNSNKYEIYNNYLNFNLIKEGICYVTSSIPDEIKFLIIELVKKRYIRLILSTSIIIDGIDLPIDNTFLTTSKIDGNDITINNFINYAGRSGRINSYKKTYGLSYTSFNIPKLFFDDEIKENKELECKKWIKKNKKKVKQTIFRNNTKYIKDEMVNKDNKFVISSCKKYRETRDNKYIIDPRINPNTTNKIHEEYDSNISDEVIETIFKNNNNSKKMIISKILNIYKYKEYGRKNNKNEDYICNEIVKFVNYNFSLEKYVRNTLNSLNHSNYYNNLDSINRKSKITKILEEKIETIKYYGKHLFLMFLNHLFVLLPSSKYPNFNEILSMYIFNSKIFKLINETNIAYLLKKAFFENKLDASTYKYWMEFNFKNRDVSVLDYIINISKLKSKVWEKFKNIICEDFIEKYIITIIIKNNSLFILCLIIDIQNS